jgi:hypothetical protein
LPESHPGIIEWTKFLAHERFVSNRLQPNLNLSPKWEVNFGLGVTRSTDHRIAKMILGHRFDF